MEDFALHGFIAFAAVALFDLFALAKVIGRGAEPEGTLAWVFAILAFPGLGAAAYVILSGPSLKRTRSGRRRVLERSRAQLRCVDLPEPESHGVRAVLGVARHASGLPQTHGNRVDLLIRTDQAFDLLLAALLGARRSISAEYYIVKNDETGNRFLDVLAQKAKEGVEVRFLYDAIGSFGLDRGRLATLCGNGGRCEAFLPFNPLRRRWSVQQRNHRKIVIVDDEVAFTGGMNVGNEYSGQLRKRSRQAFRDSHLAIRGPAVEDLALTFAEDWAFATGEPVEVARRARAGTVDARDPAGSATVAVVPSGPDQRPNANSMVHFTAINEARERVWLTSPYFIPDSPTARALESAGMRGVDVRVLVPGACDVKLVDLAARSYYASMLAAGVRIFEYQPAMLHAKSIAVDGAFGLVGSANMDMRSFRLNFELGAIVVDAEFVRSLEAAFTADLAKSVEVKADDVRAWPRWKQARDRVARLLSPLL